MPVRLGVVTGINEGGAQVDVSIIAPAWAPDTIRLIGFPFPSTLATGQLWGFCDFEGHARTGIARWNTLVAEWPSGR